MIAGGVGNIRTDQVHKSAIAYRAPASSYSAVRRCSSVSAAARRPRLRREAVRSRLDFASVQRENPEMQRRCQEVIDRCWQLRRGQSDPFHPRCRRRRAVQRPSRAGRRREAGRAIRAARRSLRRPRDVPARDLVQRVPGALRPRDRSGTNGRLRGAVRARALSLGGGRRGDAGPDAGGARRGVRLHAGRHADAGPARRPPPHAPRRRPDARPCEDAFEIDRIEIGPALERVLRTPAVADKSFLVTIGDRTVGGLVARDQMVGPWQVPVADCAVTSERLLRGHRRSGRDGRAHAARAARRAAPRPGWRWRRRSRTSRRRTWRASTGWCCRRTGWPPAVNRGRTRTCSTRWRRWRWSSVPPSASRSRWGRTRCRCPHDVARRCTARAQGGLAGLARSSRRSLPSQDAHLSLVPMLCTDLGPIRRCCSSISDYGANRLGGFGARALRTSALAPSRPISIGPRRCPRCSGRCPACGARGWRRRTTTAPTAVLPRACWRWPSPAVRGWTSTSRRSVRIRSQRCSARSPAPCSRCATPISAPCARCSTPSRRCGPAFTVSQAIDSGDRVRIPNRWPHPARGIPRRAASDVVGDLVPHAAPARRSGLRRRGICAHRRRERTGALVHDHVRSWTASSKATGTSARMPDAGTGTDTGLDSDSAVPFVARARPRVAILREQGVNGHVEMAAAFDAAGFDAFDVHMSDLARRSRLARRVQRPGRLRRLFVRRRARSRRGMGTLDTLQPAMPGRIRSILRARRHVHPRRVQRMPDARTAARPDSGRSRLAPLPPKPLGAVRGAPRDEPHRAALLRCSSRGWKARSYPTVVAHGEGRAVFDGDASEHAFRRSARLPAVHRHPTAVPPNAIPPIRTARKPGWPASPPRTAG